MDIVLKKRHRTRTHHKEIITREFPANATIVVHEGDQVTPETVIAHYETSGGFRIFHLPELLHVSRRSVQKHLRKKAGDKIYTGEIIAATGGRGFLGFFKGREFKSPIDGTIASLSEHGDMTIKVLPQRVNQGSLYWGKVVSINQKTEKSEPQGGHASVAIETQILTLHGVMGSGRLREGRIAILCDASDFLLPQKIEQSSENAMLVCGSLIERGSLEKALSLKASGIIAGGIHLRDATAMGIRLPSAEAAGTDVGISIVATEGFGPATIGGDLFELCKKYEGRYATIFGNESIIAIPLKPEELPASQDNLGTPKEETVVAKTGMTVRLLVEGYFGKIGTVAEISSATSAAASGFTDYTLTVELGNEPKQRVTVPASNVEAIA